MTLAYADIKEQCQEIRDSHVAMHRARPEVYLYTNKPDGSPGLIRRGKCTNDNIAGEFPFKKTGFGATGVLTLRLDHYLAKWMTSLPNDNTVKKNVIIRVDHMGGIVRWTGLLRFWKAVKKDGLWYLEITFISDEQYMQFLLGAPNPLLPIPIFQWPRVLPLFGPSKWAISMMILLNLIRQEGNLWNLPPDPFAVGAWTLPFDWSGWQVLIKANPFDLDDSSLWTLLATRMTRMDQVIADAMDDAQLCLTYRRVFTDEGETADVPGVATPANGALILEVVDFSGYYGAGGTATGGGIVGGFIRTAQGFVSGFVEDTQTFVGDPESFPDVYSQPGYLGPGDPSIPFVVIRDSKYSAIETAELTWGPATAVSAIVGGDNPYADQATQLMIETIGALLGYFLLVGFSDIGSITADVVMPFLVGTILAWLQWTNISRAHDLGWAHLWEVFGQGADNNAWSFGGVVALRGAFLATKSESAHKFSMGSGGRWLPGVHFVPGSRVGSTFELVSDQMLVDQVEEYTLSWDYSADRAHEYDVQVGLAKAAMTLAERQTRLWNKALATLQNFGVHLLS